jgi:spermidine synthase
LDDESPAFVKPTEILASAKTPDGSLLQLVRHDADYVIRAEGYDLMTSRVHNSEGAMMTLAYPDPPSGACVLVGGLGMGYTLAATLASVDEHSTVVVGELIPEVIEWNRGPLGPLAGNPLDDPRTEVYEGDVGRLIRSTRDRFDAILLDVDNGPDSYTDRGNYALYTRAGLDAAYKALRPGGALAVWSVGAEPTFERRLKASGFTPSTHRLAAHGKRGRTHVVFVGKRP